MHVMQSRVFIEIADKTEIGRDENISQWIRVIQMWEFNTWVLLQLTIPYTLTISYTITVHISEIKFSCLNKFMQYVTIEFQYYYCL